MGKSETRRRADHRVVIRRQGIATQRGNSGTAQAGTVASAVRFLAKAIITGSAQEFLRRHDIGDLRAREIEWPRQRRLVPAHTAARALHHAQRHRIRARREGVIGKLALARQNFGPGIKERARLDRNPARGRLTGRSG